MSLYRLVYYSGNRILNALPTFRAEIDQILLASRRNNTLVGVTGALMFSSNYFGQVLEGSQAAVEATFERIQQDTRHGDVALLEFVAISQRSFENWAMAYVGEQPDAFAAIASETGFDGHNISGEALFLRLQSMVNSAASL